MNDAIYGGRRVLVTGHTGFKGSWLSLWLQRLGAEVSGLALAPATQPALFEAARVGEDMHSLLIDVRDAEAVLHAIQRRAPEIVFHLAAQPLVRAGYTDPLRTLSTNVMGTAHVLDAARRVASVRAVVVVTSDKCYRENHTPWGYREHDPLGGHDPYAASKAAAEIITAAWRDSYPEGRPLIASARAGNVIGGGDWSDDRLVPDLWRAAHENRTAAIRNPAAVRPWQHVLESLAGYLRLGECLLAGDESAADAWNFGPALEDMQSVRTVCEILCPAFGVSWYHDGSAQPREAPVLRLDSSKAHLMLGWRPRFDLSRALRLTGDWYARYDRGEDARQLCLEQIEIYERSGAVP